MKPLQFVFKILLVRRIGSYHLTASYIIIPRLGWLALGFGSVTAYPCCGFSGSDLLNVFWVCPILSTFWRNLFTFFETAHLPVPPTPEVGLLGILNDFIPRTHNRSLVHLLLFYAHKIILLNWKNAASPFHTTVLSPSEY